MKINRATIKLMTFMLVTMIIMFAFPCSADLDEGLDINIQFYGPNWDINHDGTDNYLDASSLVAHYLQTEPPHWIRDDINEDGIVNYLDASSIVGHYGEWWIVI